jgi:general secretion pathway protein G
MIVVRSSRKGFTLVELLIVLLVLSVLTWVALPLTKVAVQRGKEIELRRSLRLVRGAIDAYKKLADEKKFEVDEETEGYPPTLEILVEGVEIKDQEEGGASRTRIVKFLRRIPKDPMTDSTEWGLRSTQDDPDASSWGEENVYDIYTRSPAKALDGTRYRDW